MKMNGNVYVTSKNIPYLVNVKVNIQHEDGT